MRNDKLTIVPGAGGAGRAGSGAAGSTPLEQGVRGVAGRLRPYRDVRAGFEPWRRVALVAWAAREEAWTVH